MPKEDRSDWVAVAPEFQAAGPQDGVFKIRPASSAYQFFQKDVTEEAKAELIAAEGKFEVGKFSRLVRERWNNLDPEEKAHYEGLAQEDSIRFRSESHAADVAAMERKAKLRAEREQLIVDDEGGDQRKTRGQRKKNEKKKIRMEKKRRKKPRTKEDSDGSDEDSGESYKDEGPSSDSDDSDDSEASKKRKPKPKPAPRKMSQKQIEHREKLREEKQGKERYIEQRQDDLRKEKADQAKRRLMFLLKQSSIFSHFGAVKEDQAKFGIKANTKRTGTDGESRRSALGDDEGDQQDAADLEDDAQTTFLTTQPTTLGFGKMRTYQLEGLNWMIRLQENGVNGILADEMGLGKTLQSISVLVYMLEYRKVTGPHLIVVPKSTLSNWMGELARWAPSLTAVKFHGDRASREEIIRKYLEPGQRDEDRTWNVCVTTYEICNIEKNVMNKFAWQYLIIDEAHRLKNEASAFSKTVRQFETRYRILLTGTPLQNSLHELWALLNFLVPDVFANAEQFDEWFNLDIEDNDEKNRLISQLHKILRPFMLRRLKADVEKSLPPKHETILFTGMSSMQKKLYRDILIRDIDAIQGKNAGSRTAILNIVMQLRKCAGHPYLFPGVEDRSLPPLGEHLVENCGKMVLLDKLLKRLRESGHRVLLFTQMTRILDLMEDYLVMRRFPYCRIDGNTSYDDREDYIEAYNAPNSEKFLFLLSTRAGGLGINLQTADVVILYDSDWNPQADLQAQDRAHRIGQKRPVQVFRFVTEHTIEEKIVERAQQKLKLDAMVVQQGRLKDKGKMSRDDLLEAVRFGADKIFKSKDSSITDDDIDLILNAGKRKTQELNDKLKAAEKGDLLDFKLDGGGNVQTFEGVDYSSNALAQAKAEAELISIIDIGKRERKPVANYNENLLYQQQIAALQGKSVKAPKKKKEIKLPKHLRLPRMEDFQMYDREALLKIQEEEEKAFRELPEEQQKMAATKKKEQTQQEAEEKPAEEGDVKTEPEEPFELPPLLDEEKQQLKAKLLAEGFADWKRQEYLMFIKASAKYGRTALPSIAADVGKSEADVERYASAFWGDLGKTRFSEHEYDRVFKLIEKGEKKIDEIKSLERGTRILVSLFSNPWDELEFNYVNCKDKMFTSEEDRHLLCWTHKFGYGQWNAIKMAIRRSPAFRFDYFIRSLSVDLLGKRCEQLMKFAEKEVEQLEQKAREQAGLPSEPTQEGDSLQPIELPEISILREQIRSSKKEKLETERKQLEEKAAEAEKQLKDVQDKLKALTESSDYDLPGSAVKEPPDRGQGESSEKENADAYNESKPDGNNEENGAMGPEGFLEFPEYDGSEEPKESKKAFTHFCMHTRKEVKATLDPSERKNKEVVHGILRERWVQLADDDKTVWRQWASWDKKRYERDLAIYEEKNSNGGNSTKSQTNGDKEDSIHVPKKRKPSAESDVGSPSFNSIPKKRRSA
ncbi:Probable chromatin-remodeling complex ATPase chain [Seminavis robusta]|uniref:Probable chromatin-remodeling complex ATPase chain n=1 Tax=Seminavis robusta TaxID=568900 RepID=A0A9N8DY26_9STRA|nr:Probable chromatin-remodeling complex ATPase chain [Seminavis robusta]|eukprot:Sro358_g125960.1 Probable chromatin-remodeling complex ATPase chain (1450) ;mRNA; f:58197-63158